MNRSFIHKQGNNHSIIIFIYQTLVQNCVNYDKEHTCTITIYSTKDFIKDISNISCWLATYTVLKSIDDVQCIFKYFQHSYERHNYFNI